ncbi:MAG: DUF349 domain-containing protein [Propionibacteriaceae bacterium]|jgi:hypothetical protein|nr:DUF349 domain-containing protein [Propionibacteriaceae bacterium]
MAEADMGAQPTGRMGQDDGESAAGEGDLTSALVEPALVEPALVEPALVDADAGAGAVLVEPGSAPLVASRVPDVSEDESAEADLVAAEPGPGEEEPANGGLGHQAGGVKPVACATEPGDGCLKQSDGSSESADVGPGLVDAGFDPAGGLPDPADGGVGLAGGGARSVDGTADAAGGGDGSVDGTADAAYEGAESADGGPELVDGQAASASPRSTARRREREAAQAIKEGLCAQVELGAITWGSGQAKAEMGRIMAEWKRAGHAGKRLDNELWDRLNAARDLLYGRLGLANKLRREANLEAKARKGELIAQAQRLAESGEGMQAGERMAQLLAEWKAAGSAGRQDDQQLWEQFKAAHDEVFSRVKQARQERDAVRRQGAASKRQVIDEARGLIGSLDLSGARARMRELGDEFRASPSPGREAGRKLLAEFQQVKDEFYAWAKAEPTRRKESGQRSTYFVRARKVQDADELRSEIARVEAELAAMAPGGAARKQHGSSVVLSLGDTTGYAALSAELIRLRLRLDQVERQVGQLDAKLTAPERSKEAAEEVKLSESEASTDELEPPATKQPGEGGPTSESAHTGSGEIPDESGVGGRMDS